MSTSISSATDKDDFYTRLIAFLTTNGILVAANQNWSVAWTHSDGQQSGIVLRGPGLTGNDAVYIGLRLTGYEIQMYGMTGIKSSATNLTGHVNVSPYYVRMFLSSATMNYWFTATGRRFMVTAQVGTVHQAMYGGLFLPYATPIQYPYPLFIGGSAGETDASGLTSWSSTSDYHHHFPYGYFDAEPNYHRGSAWMLSPDGDWLSCGVTGSALDIGIGPRNWLSGYEVEASATETNYGYNSIRIRMRPALGGAFALTPFTLVRASGDDVTYGILDGAYHVTGNGNTAENTITAGGNTYLTVPDVFRSGDGDFWAMSLD